MATVEQDLRIEMVHRPTSICDARDRFGLRPALWRSLDALPAGRHPADGRRVADACARSGRGDAIGFSLFRTVADESELLLLGGLTATAAAASAVNSFAIFLNAPETKE